MTHQKKHIRTSKLGKRFVAGARVEVEEPEEENKNILDSRPTEELEEIKDEETKEDLEDKEDKEESEEKEDEEETKEYEETGEMKAILLTPVNKK